MSRRAAVIGLGDISAIHLAAIEKQPDAELVAVCDVDPVRAADVAARIGVRAFTDHATLFAEGRVDVVHICTPHAAHAAAAIAALDAGIHVILEKPVARDPQQAAAVVAAARRNAAKITVCFQNRYNPPVAAAKRLLDSGSLGAVTGAAGTVIWHRTPAYYANSPWRGTWDGGGGGLLMNQAIHTLDLLCWLVGPVTAVDGTAVARALPIEVEDTAELSLTHANGARSMFYATNAHAANDPVTVSIVTEQAELFLRGDLTVTYADGRVETVREERTAQGERSYWGMSHERLIADFYAHLDDPEPFWIAPDDGARLVDLIHRVYRDSYPEQIRKLRGKGESA